MYISSSTKVASALQIKNMLYNVIRILYIVIYTDLMTHVYFIINNGGKCIAD